MSRVSPLMLGWCKGAPPKHPSSPSKSRTFLFGAGVGWFSFTYQSGFQLAFALGNLTKLNAVLPVREISSCFLDIIWRAKPLPRVQKNSLKLLAASPAEVHRLSLSSSTIESSRELERVFAELECILWAGLRRGLWHSQITCAPSRTSGR